MTEPMILRARRLRAPIRHVRHALTDPPRCASGWPSTPRSTCPGTYAFWGRYTPEGDAPHQRLLHADDHTLRFAGCWTARRPPSSSQLSEERPDSTDR